MKDPLTEMIEGFESQYAKVLPDHLPADAFVRLASGVVRRNEKLRDVARHNPASFLSALLDCARLGHEPGTDQYALVPMGDEVVGIEQYQGAIERMYRAGAVASVKAEIVREHDHWKYNRSVMTVPDHQPDDFASDEERGPLRGVYAYAVMKDGSTSRVVVMGRAEVMKHKAASKMAQAKPKESPWNGPFEHSMWLKTAVHELEKWVPTSARYLQDMLRAAARAQEEGPRLANPVPPATPPPASRIVDMPTRDEAPASPPVDEPQEPRDEPEDVKGEPAEEPPPGVDPTTGEVTDAPTAEAPPTETSPGAYEETPTEQGTLDTEHARNLRAAAASSWGDGETPS